MLCATHLGGICDLTTACGKAESLFRRASVTEEARSRTEGDEQVISVLCELAVVFCPRPGGEGGRVLWVGAGDRRSDARALTLHQLSPCSTVTPGSGRGGVVAKRWQ